MKTPLKATCKCSDRMETSCRCQPLASAEETTPAEWHHSGRVPEKGCSSPGLKLPGELGTSPEGWGKQRECPCLEEVHIMRSYVTKLQSGGRSGSCTVSERIKRLMASSPRPQRWESGEKESAVTGGVRGDSQDGEDQSCVNSGAEESMQRQ